MFSLRFKWRMEANRLAQLLAAKRQAGAPLLDLTEANPTRVGFTYPTEPLLGALAQLPALLYEPAPRGLLIAREAVAAYYREHNCFISPERLHLTASTSEGYSYLFKLLCDQGQSVLAPQPSYPLFEFLAALEGVELRPYELHYVHPAGWQIDFVSLRSALMPDTRAILVVSPNNPTGSFLKRAELVQLDAICAEHELALIVDEVFSDYALLEDDARAPSLITNEEVLTFVLNGFSKILALPQMKLGWIATNGPAALRRVALERLDLIADTFLSVGAPVQHAAPVWLRLRADLQQQILARVHGNLLWLTDLFTDSPCRVLKVEGGWYAVLEIPRYFSEEEWVLMLLERDDVLVHPGYFFDFAREAFLIVSLLPPPEVFREAAKRLWWRIT